MIEKTTLGGLITAVAKISVTKTTVSKYLDFARLGKQIAVMTGDGDAESVFEQEINGYTGDVPPYRMLDGTTVRSSIGDIIRMIENNSNDMNAIVKIDGHMFRMNTLKHRILFNFETYTWEFIGKILKSASADTGIQMPQISLDGLPPELAEKIAEMM